MTTTATTSARRPPRRKKLSLQSLLIQAAFVATVAATLGYFAVNAIHAVNSRGMTAGFGFLERPRGWSMPATIFATPATDTYSATILASALNTLVVGLAAIVVATLAGFLLGLAQVGRNVILRALSRSYVQVFRNIPTIIYVLFIFGLMLSLPGPRQALRLFDVIYLTNRGLRIPSLEAPASYWLAVSVVTLTATAAFLLRRKLPAHLKLPSSGAVVAGLLLAGWGVISLTFSLTGHLSISLPALQGFNFIGGTTFTIEATTLTLALAVFGSAYIGEIVRGGLLSVPKGMIEAATALGLKPWQIFSLVRMPIAMRSIIPAISNQYLYMMKATSVGIVIGFSDLFAVASLSINYSGQTLEVLALMMMSYIIINFTLSRMTEALNAHLRFKTKGN